MLANVPEVLRGPPRGRTSAHDVRLRYPRSWAMPVSPHAAAMARRTLAWLRQRGVVHDQETSQRFERLSVAEYANWLFAMATPARAEVITKFLSLWIFYDDAIEEADDGQARAIHDAIRAASRTPPDGDRHLHCWWELGQQYGRSMSRAWLDRHADRFSEWVVSVADEREIAAAFRATGRYPTVATQLAARRLNIGMYPNIDFLEYQMGWELPAEVLADPLMHAVERCAAEAVAIINDIFGYSKDGANRWCNLVSCLAAEDQLEADEAFGRAAVMHDERIVALVAYEEELITKYAHKRELADWFAGLHCVVYGFAKWHSRAPRYSACHVVDGREIRIAIAETRAA